MQVWLNDEGKEGEVERSGDDALKTGKETEGRRDRYEKCKYGTES